MKKQDILIVILLFGLLIAWPYVSGLFFPPAPTPISAVSPATQTAVASDPQKSVPAAAVSLPAPAALAMTSAADKVETMQIVPTTTVERPVGQEQTIVLSNNVMAVQISSKGGGVVYAELRKFRKAIEKNSGPVVLDFTETPALTLRGIQGLTAADGFDLMSGTNAQSALLTGKTASGLRVRRTLSLGPGYQLIAEDEWVNETEQPLAIPDFEVQVAPMHALSGETASYGVALLGVDALPSSGGDGVMFWADKLVDIFADDQKARQLPGAAEAVSKKEPIPIDWVAAKNKFFVQILLPEGGASGYRVQVDRDIVPGERQNPALIPKKATVRNVMATALMSGKALTAGESFRHVYRYYIGPKDYSILKGLGLHQDEVMEFGWWKPVCKVLLVILNTVYSYWPNYGVAIILLTILIRILFWPLTHKSTESMKKMQALQPQMAALKEKFKDNPKKMQMETMALYRENKVNPVSGCLPIVIQIPVFIALFVVLRSAVELRFAEFLWVVDLSEPERLFANILPYPLNILPIFMAATQAWQQSLMPAGDPVQQKVMLVFMPIMMLVMFYMMPSALVLYWSTNQTIVIAQQLIQKYRTRNPAPVPAVAVRK